MADKITCENCGFLALRNRISGLLDEAPQEYRWRAEVPEFRRPGVNVSRSMADFYDHPYTGVPICLVRAHPLHNEFANQDQVGDFEIFGTLTKERNCADRKLFTPWRQGFSPKEHREMIDRREQREWQESVRRSDRNWRIVEVFLILAGTLLAGFGGAYIQANATRSTNPVINVPTAPAPVINVLPIPLPTVNVVLPSVMPEP